MPTRTTKQLGAFRLHVELDDVAPPVWRKLLVQSNITLEELHYAVNETMGWTNSHLHQFLLGQRCFSDKTMPDAEVHDFEDERTVYLDSLLSEGDTIAYEYDFGDGWSHRVTLEKTLKFDGRNAYPLCIRGARVSSRRLRLRLRGLPQGAAEQEEPAT